MSHLHLDSLPSGIPHSKSEFVKLLLFNNNLKSLRELVKSKGEQAAEAAAVNSMDDEKLKKKLREEGLSTDGGHHDFAERLIAATPVTVNSISMLCHLDISFNAITELPAEFKHLRHLKYLDIGYNNIAKVDEEVMDFLTNGEASTGDTRGSCLTDPHSPLQRCFQRRFNGILTAF